MPVSAVTIAPGAWLAHYREISDLEHQRIQAMRHLAHLRERIAHARKTARKAGCDLEAMKLMDGLTALSERRANTRLEHLKHYMSWASLPIEAIQGTLFSRPTNAEYKAHELWVAEADGRDVALAGGSMVNNPYTRDTEHALRWNAGYRSVNAAALLMHGAISPLPRRMAIITAAKRGRGRPKGSKNKLKGAIMVRKLRAEDVARRKQEERNRHHTIHDPRQIDAEAVWQASS